MIKNKRKFLFITIKSIQPFRFSTIYTVVCMRGSKLTSEIEVQFR